MVYLKLEYTTGIKLASVACARGKRVSPGVLARLCSTIASMKALDHANTLLLLLCPYEVHAPNKEAAVYVCSNTLPVLYWHTLRKEEVRTHISWSTGSFGLHDSF